MPAPNATSSPSGSAEMVEGTPNSTSIIPATAVLPPQRD